MVMVMNGFDTNFDRANEVYAANTIGFAYMDEPIVTRDELVRVYLVNVLEYDLINSFHLHGNLFDYFPTGTEEPAEFTDTVMLCQGQRGSSSGASRTPASSCSTRTSPSSPSSAGRASSRWSDGGRAATVDDVRPGGCRPGCWVWSRCC